MKILAPCKVNLYLEVKRKRKDGYHDIETVMQTVGLCDELTIEPLEKGIELGCNWGNIPCDSSNLVVKAALALQKMLGISKGAKIFLKKRVPAGAGLGGGSSDAAAALTGLLKLWKKKLTDKKLNGIAAKIGADVPFFLKGGTALATGIGDKIKHIKPLKNLWFVIVFPGFGVPTKEVYCSLKFPLTIERKNNRIKKLLNSLGKPQILQSVLFNRLEEVVFPKYAYILNIKNEMNLVGYSGLMSGSGSSVFCVAKSERAGKNLKKRLSRPGRQIWVVKAQPENKQGRDHRR